MQSMQDAILERISAIITEGDLRPLRQAAWSNRGSIYAQAPDLSSTHLVATYDFQDNYCTIDVKDAANKPLRSFHFDYHKAACMRELFAALRDYCGLTEAPCPALQTLADVRKEAAALHADDNATGIDFAQFAAMLAGEPNDYTLRADFEGIGAR